VHARKLPSDKANAAASLDDDVTQEIHQNYQNIGRIAYMAFFSTTSAKNFHQNCAASAEIICFLRFLPAVGVDMKLTQLWVIQECRKQT